MTRKYEGSGVLPQENLQSEIPVRTQKAINLKTEDMMKLPLRPIGLVDIKTYVFTPNRVLADVGVLVPGSLVTDIEPMNLWAEATMDMQVTTVTKTAGYGTTEKLLPPLPAAPDIQMLNWSAPGRRDDYAYKTGDVSFNLYGSQGVPDYLVGYQYGNCRYDNQPGPLATSIPPGDTRGGMQFDVEVDLAEAMNSSMTIKDNGMSENLRVKLRRMELEEFYQVILEEKRLDRSESPKTKVIRKRLKSIMKDTAKSILNKKVSFQPKKDISLVEQHEDEDCNYLDMPPENSYVMGKAFAAQATTSTKPPAAPDERSEASRIIPQSSPAPVEPEPNPNDRKWRWLDKHKNCSGFQ
ncbi:hypothetical protein TWF481_003007 [Arthrobotrys musiformis]|uniref:Uncharacterized protein n=1 Tax=Arthrobotrys musiformis TaxID=47236 RepID=A0AAV9VT60_9PEZI